MREFTEQMEADHEEALRISAVETAKAQTETAKLREVLAKIGGFANSWAEQWAYSSASWSRERFKIVEETCLAALNEPKPPTGPVSHVIVDGRIYSGNVVELEEGEENPEDWIKIEVADIDPTAGRMEVSGPRAGFIKS